MVCRILVADDSSTIQKVIRIGLASIPTNIKSVGSYVEAAKAASPDQFDLIIADAGLPGVSTASDFVKLLERAGNIPMILLMGSYDAVRESDLRAAGIEHIIKKPFPPGELPQLVQQLAGHSFQVAPASAPPPAVTPPAAPIRERVDQQSAPVAFSLTDDAAPMVVPHSQSSPRQSIPWAAPSFLAEPDDLSMAGIPPIPEVEPTRRGRPAYDLAKSDESLPRPASVSATSLPQPPVASSPRQAGLDTVSGMSAAVEAFVRNELPSLVDRAVERYCVDHFKSVAREVLTAELRRLAEEKARYLVDQ